MAMEVSSVNLSEGPRSPRAETRLEASTKQQLVKTVRALKQSVLKRATHADPLFGARSKALSLNFILRRTPVRLKSRPLQIPLPHPMFAGRPADGFFVKANSQRKLHIPFGWCSMGEDHLVENAVAMIGDVRKGLGSDFIREMWLQEMDGLSLPVWSRSSEKAAKCKRRVESSMAAPAPVISALQPARQCKRRAEGSMGPPASPPAKKVRTA